MHFGKVKNEIYSFINPLCLCIFIKKMSSLASTASLESAPYDSIVRSVIGKFETRAALGLKKYGTNLDRKDLSICEWINHAQEEHMDAILYLEKLKQELISWDLPQQPIKEQEKEHEKKKKEREKNQQGCADCSACFLSCPPASHSASVSSSVSVHTDASASLAQTREAFLRLKKQQEFHEGLRGK